MHRSLLGAVSAALLVGVAFSPVNANALTLKEAMAVTLESNPEIGQANENREATEFELRQARGLYLPGIDLESGVGLSVTPKLFDGGARRAARVDSASFRVLAPA